MRSSLDFWRKEKLPEILSKSGEKLSAADYLDAETLTKIMKRDDQLLTKFFRRMSNELEAMGAVTKEAFWNVADHFLGNYSLGRTREKEIRILQDNVREEVRAEALFRKEDTVIKGERSPEVQSQSQPLSKKGTQHIEEKNERVISSLPCKESPLNEKPHVDRALVTHSLIDSPVKTNNPIKVPEKVIQHQHVIHSPQYKREIVEDTLKAHMADFADHVFSSIGEDCNRSMSSRTERRYGKKGEFSVNLQKGVWLSYKDSEMAGGPLHLLTKLKNLHYEEAIEYGASWARLSPEQPMLKQTDDPSRTQKETLEKEKEGQEIKQKIERAQSLYTKGLPIQETLAERYLREHRKIEGSLPKDLLYLPANSVRKSSLPALMAIARSHEGEVTAVQLTFLNPHTANKADINVQKKSFGSLKGVAVTIQEDKGSNLLFIAEGVETALSLKEAEIKGTIKASLGLSNIKHLQPENPKIHIIICGDHDAPKSPATKALEKSARILQEKEFEVTVIKPDKLEEDFNDVLKTKGFGGIREILEKRLSKDLLTSILTSSEKQSQRGFHAVKDIEEKEAKQPLKSEKETPEFTLEGKSFKEIVAYCEKRLNDTLVRDNKPLTKERVQRFPLQAEKTAAFLLHAYECNGQNPTREEVSQLSLRVKYELNRIPAIRRELINDWKEKGSFKEAEGLRAHMVAERLASIEGRLYLKAKQVGTKVSSNIAKIAHQELKNHQAHTPKLAGELSQKYVLPKDVAINSAKNILRYKEIHGVSPSESQVANIIQVAQKLVRKQYAPVSNKKLNQLEADYLQRYEGDLLFKHIACQKETKHDLPFSHIQDQAKKSLEIAKSQINQELIKMNEKEFSF